MSPLIAKEATPKYVAAFMEVALLSVLAIGDGIADIGRLRLRAEGLQASMEQFGCKSHVLLAPPL